MPELWRGYTHGDLMGGNVPTYDLGTFASTLLLSDGAPLTGEAQSDSETATEPARTANPVAVVVGVKDLGAAATVDNVAFTLAGTGKVDASGSYEPGPYVSPTYSLRYRILGSLDGTAWATLIGYTSVTLNILTPANPPHGSVERSPQSLSASVGGTYRYVAVEVRMQTSGSGPGGPYFPSWFAVATAKLNELAVTSEEVVDDTCPVPPPPTLSAIAQLVNNVG